jgi:UrcA family protein
MKTGMVFFAALALVSVKANASPITVTPGPAVHVNFSDLDLNSREGRAVLERRIHSAAETLCSTEGDRTLDTAMANHDCFKAALADGLQQMDRLNQERIAQRSVSTGAGH